MKFDSRTTELIALGASAAANCQSCVEYHGRKAAEYGIDPGDVAQAVEIGRAVRKGAAANVDQVTDGLAQKDTSAASGAASAGGPVSEAGCCGSAKKQADSSAESGERTCFPNRCAPFGSMMDAWRSGGFQFPGQPAAKS
jgi:AhpD family alkylhydroperoxidase